MDALLNLPSAVRVHTRCIKKMVRQLDCSTYSRSHHPLPAGIGPSALGACLIEALVTEKKGLGEETGISDTWTAVCAKKKNTPVVISMLIHIFPCGIVQCSADLQIENGQRKHMGSSRDLSSGEKTTVLNSVFISSP